MALGQSSLYLTSHCYHCQWNWEAWHSTASLNHWFIIIGFQEQIGSKLATHWHYGQLPAAFWLQIDTSEMLFVIDQTLP